MFGRSATMRYLARLTELDEDDIGCEDFESRVEAALGLEPGGLARMTADLPRLPASH